MDKPRVFISYTHTGSNGSWARKFAEALSNMGVQVWFDDFNVRAGQPLADAIEGGLRESDFVVLLVNSENVQPPNLFFELGAAVGMKKPIIPIVPEDLDVYQLPIPLQRIKYLIRKSPEESARETAKAVETLSLVATQSEAVPV